MNTKPKEVFLEATSQAEIPKIEPPKVELPNDETNYLKRMMTMQHPPYNRTRGNKETSFIGDGSMPLTSSSNYHHFTQMAEA